MDKYTKWWNPGPGWGKDITRKPQLWPGHSEGSEKAWPLTATTIGLTQNTIKILTKATLSIFFTECPLKNIMTTEKELDMMLVA
jgi:hypothetical protein